MFDKKVAANFLMNLYGVKEGVLQQMESTIEILRQLVSSRDPEKVDQVIEAFRAHATGEVQSMIDLTGAVICNILTEAELEAVYNFYSSDLGKSVIGKMPLMVKAGQDVGKEFAAQIIRWTEKALAEAQVPSFTGEIPLDF